MTNLTNFQDQLRKMVGDTFAAASDHPYSCTCQSCREWWLGMGPDPDDMAFGPFGDSLWKDYAARYDMTVEEVKFMCEQERL